MQDFDSENYQQMRLQYDPFHMTDVRESKHAYTAFWGRQQQQGALPSKVIAEAGHFLRNNDTKGFLNGL
jgi:hypothetical protein